MVKFREETEARGRASNGLEDLGAAGSQADGPRRDRESALITSIAQLPASASRRQRSRESRDLILAAGTAVGINQYAAAGRRVA